MANRGMLVLTILVALSTYSHCFHWTDSQQDDAVLSVCVGDDVTLPWDFETAASEDTEDVKWEYETESTSRLMAFYSDGLFRPSDSYRQRVSRHANGRVVITDVTVKDSGRYSIKVEVQGQDGVRHYQRSVSLQVKDGVRLTGDGKLHVRQEGVTGPDDVTNSLTLTLSCGTFRFTQLTPRWPYVTWTTPTGERVNSTDYSDGRFYLSLPAPVTEGVYTCHIPPQHLSDTCLTHGHHGNDSVRVDSVKVNVLQALAEQETLRAEDAKLNDSIAQLSAQCQKLTAENEKLKAEDEKLKAEQQRLKADSETAKEQCQDLQSEVNALKAENAQLKEEMNDLVSGLKQVIDSCPRSWSLQGESCYKYVTEPAAWQDAQAQCQTMGGGLVEVDTEPENSFVFSIVRSQGAGGAWLGLSDVREEGRFVLPSGRDPLFTRWHEGEPNNAGDEDCAMYWTARKDFGDRWNDASCNSLKPFVCERRTLF